MDKKSNALEKSKCDISVVTTACQLQNKRKQTKPTF